MIGQITSCIGWPEETHRKPTTRLLCRPLNFVQHQLKLLHAERLRNTYCLKVSVRALENRDSNDSLRHLFPRGHLTASHTPLFLLSQRIIFSIILYILCMMMFSQFNTCSMVLYLTLQYQGSVATLRDRHKNIH